MLKKLDFDKRLRERIVDIDLMQSEQRLIIDPFYVHQTAENAWYQKALIQSGNDPLALESIEAEFKRLHDNWLRAVELYYPFEFIMELHALYKKWGAKLNGTQYEGTVEPGQDTSG